MPLLRCQQVSRFFGERPVLREASFTAGPGQLIALSGANGAGKSTLLRILAGALRPSFGAAELDGVATSVAAARRRIGFLSHQSLLHPVLTVEENLQFYATLFGLASPRVAIAQALERVQGVDLAGRRAGELSQGMKQKAALARCLLHQPELLLLDEPFASLDQATVADLRSCLGELRDSGTMLVVSSHQREYLQELANAEIRLERGRLSVVEAGRHV